MESGCFQSPPLAVGIWCVTVLLKEPPICRGILSDTGTSLFHLQRESLVWRADTPRTQDHKICPRVLFLCTVRGTKAPELGTDPIGQKASWLLDEIGKHLEHPRYQDSGTVRTHDHHGLTHCSASISCSISSESHSMRRFSRGYMSGLNTRAVACRSGAGNFILAVLLCE